MPSGRWSFNRLTSIDVKPNTALVTWPDAVAMSVGSAKNARYASELPSSSRTVATPHRKPRPADHLTDDVRNRLDRGVSFRITLART